MERGIPSHLSGAVGELGGFTLGDAWSIISSFSVHRAMGCFLWLEFTKMFLWAERTATSTGHRSFRWASFLIPQIFLNLFQEQ